MKRLLLFIVALISLQLAVQAQDIIIRKDGSEVKAKVLEVNAQNIKYNRFDNLDGPVYSENKNLILKIKYTNGTEDIFVVKSTPQIENTDLQTLPPKKIARVRYSGLVEIAPYVGADYISDGNAFGSAGIPITTTHGIQIKDKYFVGLGMGINFEANAIYMPILYTTFRIDFSHAERRPFLSTSLGVQFGSTEGYYYNSYYSEARLNAGLWSNVMFGYQFRNKLYLAAGVTVQNSYDYVNFAVNYDQERYSTQVYSLVGLMVGFGIRF